MANPPSPDDPGLYSPSSEISELQALSVGLVADPAANVSSSTPGAAAGPSGSSPTLLAARNFSIEVQRSLPRSDGASLPRAGSSLPRSNVGIPFLVGGGGPPAVRGASSSLQANSFHGHQRTTSALGSIVSHFSSSLPRALSGQLSGSLPPAAEAHLNKEFTELENRNAVLTQWIDDLQIQNQQLQEAQDSTEEQLEAVKRQLKAVTDVAESDRQESTRKISELEEKLAKETRKLDDKDSEVRGLNYEFEEVKKNRDALIEQKRTISRRYAELEVRVTSQAMALREAGLEVHPPPNIGPSEPEPPKESVAPKASEVDSPVAAAAAASAFKLKQAMFASLPSGTLLASFGQIPGSEEARAKDDSDSPTRPSTPSVGGPDNRFQSLGRSFSIDAIRGRALKAESELGQAQQNLSTALERADTLEGALKKATTERDDLQRQLRSWKGELAELLKTVEELERNLRTTREQDIKSRAEVDEMRKRVVEREGELEQERDNIEQLSRVLSLLERQSEVAENQIEELLDKVSYLKSRNTTYKARLAGQGARRPGEGGTLEDGAGFQTFTSVMSAGGLSDNDDDSVTSSVLERQRVESLAPFVEELRKIQSELVTAHKQVVEKEDELRSIRLERTNMKTQLKEKEKARKELELQLDAARKIAPHRRHGTGGESEGGFGTEDEVQQLRKVLADKDQQIESMMREARDQIKFFMDNPGLAVKELPDIPESVVSSVAPSVPSPTAPSSSMPRDSTTKTPAAEDVDMLRAALAEMELAKVAREQELAAVQANLAEAVRCNQELEATMEQSKAQLVQAQSQPPPSRRADGADSGEVDRLREQVARSESDLVASRQRIDALEEQLAQINLTHVGELAALTKLLQTAEKERDSHVGQIATMEVFARELAEREAEVRQLNLKLSEVERASFETKKAGEGRITELEAQMKLMASHTFSRSMGRPTAGGSPSDFASMASMTLGAPASKGIGLEREVATLQAERQSFQARIARGEAEDRIVMAKMLELDKACGAAVAQSSRLNKELRELKARSEAEQQQSARAAAAAEERIAMLQRALEDLRTAAVIRSSQAPPAHEQNVADNPHVAAAIPDIVVKEFAEENTRLEGRVAELVAALAFAEQEGAKKVSALSAQLEKLNATRAQDEGRMADLAAQAIVFGQARDADQSQIAVLKAQLDAAEAAAQSPVHAAQAIAPPANDYSSVDSDDGDDGTGRLNELEATVEGLQKRCNELLRSESALKAQLADLQAGTGAFLAIPAVVALQRQLRDRETELAAMRQTLAGTGAEQESIKQELLVLRTRLETSEGTLKVKDRDMEVLKGAVAGSEELKKELEALKVKLDEGNRALVEEKRKSAAATAAITAAAVSVSKASESDGLVASLNAQISQLQSKLDQEAGARRQETGLLKGQVDAYQRQLVQNAAAAAQTGTLVAEVATLKQALEDRRQQHTKLQDLFMRERQRRRTANDMLQAHQAELEAIKRRLEDMDDTEEAQIARSLSKLQEKHEALRIAAESADDLSKVIAELAEENEVEARKADPMTMGGMPNGTNQPQQTSYLPPIPAAKQSANSGPTFTAMATPAPMPPVRVPLPKTVSSAQQRQAPPQPAPPAPPPSQKPQAGTQSFESEPSSTMAAPPKAPVPAPAEIKMPGALPARSPAPDSPLSSFSSYLGSPIAQTGALQPAAPRIVVPTYANQPNYSVPAPVAAPLPFSAPPSTQQSYQPPPTTASGYAKAPLPTRKPSGAAK